MHNQPQRKGRILLIVGGLLFLCILLGLVYYFTVYVPSMNKNPQTVEQKISDVLERSSSTESDIENQKQELQSLAEKESDTEKKAQYLSAAVDLYAASDDTSATLDVARQYEEVAKSAESAGSLASAYEQTGDYKNAARYYGIAAERSPKPASENERAAYNDYRLLQKEMEAK